jgi:hypothetical protein
LVDRSFLIGVRWLCCCRSVSEQGREAETVYKDRGSVRRQATFSRPLAIVIGLTSKVPWIVTAVYCCRVFTYTYYFAQINSA